MENMWLIVSMVVFRGFSLNYKAFLEDQGEVFSWGKDEEFSGVLAMGRMRMNQKVAIMNPNFSGIPIIALSIGEKHAGAIDGSCKTFFQSMLISILT